MGRFGPDSVITSIEYNWEPFYVHTAQAVLDGEWVSDDYWGGLADDALKMPMSSIVPEAYQNEAQEIIASIKDGSFHPFDGPVLDQKGEIRVPAGVSANKTDLASMDYYVQGIAAEFPQR
tara:strand:- start:251 stop:610 length:360 start_codon:yes stop_codon:yes gene_type:complete